MASQNRRLDFEAEGGMDDFLRPAETNQLVVMQRSRQEVEVDTEEHVQEQTEDLFRSFVHQRFRNDNSHHNYENIPTTPVLVNLPIFRDK